MRLPDLIAPARVHEATGRGRLAFALALAGGLSGPVLWVQDARRRDGLYAPGLAAFLDPARIVLARPTGPLPVLQSVEEALRSGAVPLVVAELAEAPDLTASRRLQLAAGTGGGRGLCLIPGERLRTNAAETRWRAEPVPGADACQRWEIIKNKRGRLGAWTVRWTGRAFVETGREAATA
jgi:protein ImuA